LTLDFSQREHSSVYSRNIVGELQPLSDNELITSLPCVFHPRNPHLLFEIYEKLVQTPLLSSKEAELLVDEIIYTLNADIAHKAYLQTKRTTDATHKVIDYMEKNLSKKITLDELAKVSNFEKSYFVRFFKKETGTTPFKMLSEMRLERASDLVVSTDIKIYDIAESLGYNTLSFFISEYKKRFGLTPSAHRSNVSSSNIDVKKRVN
jgi:AraC-like DNA-binding protein